MAAPDRIRLTGSLRKGSGDGALLFARFRPGRPAEDPRLAGLRPLVLYPAEPAEAPSLEQLEGLGVTRPVGGVEQQVAARPQLGMRWADAVDPGHLWRLEEVDDDQVEPTVGQGGGLARKILQRPQAQVDVGQPASSSRSRVRACQYSSSS